MSHTRMLHNRNSHTTALSRIVQWWILLTCVALLTNACGWRAIPSNNSNNPTPAYPTITVQASATPLPVQTVQITPTLGTLNLAPTPTLQAFSAIERLELFDQVWQFVQDRYVYDDYRGVDWLTVKDEYQPRVIAAPDTEAFYAVIKEMVGLLNDDHTRFDTPQEVAMDEAFYTGTADYAGVGIIIRTVAEGLMVMRLAHAGPAEMAGLRPYDIVTSVDGTAIADMIQDDFEYTRRIRGPIGSTITLGILRDGQRFDVDITRNAIPSDSFPEAFVQELPQKDIVFLTIDSFNRQYLDTLVKTALDSPFISTTPRAIIIDVRENYGGSIGAMLDVMALFQSGGVMGEQVGHDNVYTLEVPSNQTLTAYADIPMVILTSGETASAAEMFVSGMRSLRGAIIVGETTAGNTENLYPYDLSDGSTLWLAELLFRQNDGTYIDDIGVQPDITVVANWGTFKPQNDPFVIQAIETLE